MSRAALVLACLASATAGLAAGSFLSWHAYYEHVVLAGQASDDANSVIDDVTVLKQLRRGGQEADALRYLERRLEDDVEQLRGFEGHAEADKARGLAIHYLRKYLPAAEPSPQ